MVKVAGPLMSMDASGSLADSITFSKWKGRNYVRQLVTPSNPRSASQTGMRAMFKFLAQEWSGIAAGDQADWEDAAETGNYSPFNAYVKENQANWRDFLYPSEVFPITRAGTYAPITNFAATASGRNILLEGDIGVGADQNGIALFRDTSSGFTPNWDNCIAVFAGAASSSFTYTDGPLDPGTYYYRVAAFTTEGEGDTIIAEVDDTVT